MNILIGRLALAGVYVISGGLIAKVIKNHHDCKKNQQEIIDRYNLMAKQANKVNFYKK